MLRVIITDERLAVLSDILTEDLLIKNIVHICGHQAHIPSIGNAVIEAITDVKKLRINKKKSLIVAICLGTVDVISLLSSANSKKKHDNMILSFHEVTDLVFLRLQRLKNVITQFDSTARVVLFKLAPTPNAGSVKKSINEINERIHAENRNDNLIFASIQSPLISHKKITDTEYIFGLEVAKRWLQTCESILKSIISENQKFDTGVFKRNVIDVIESDEEVACKTGVMKNKNIPVKISCLKPSTKEVKKPPPRVKVISFTPNRTYINHQPNIVCKSLYSSGGIESNSRVNNSECGAPSSSKGSSSKQQCDSGGKNVLNVKPVQKYTRVLQGLDNRCTMSTKLSDNVYVLMAVNILTFGDDSLTQDLSDIAMKLALFEEDGAAIAVPTLDNHEIVCIINAVGNAVTYIETQALSQLASDILHSAVMNIKKVYVT